MNRTTRNAVLAIGMGGVLAASVMAAAPATATAQATTLACQINLGDPFRSGDLVITGANVNGCPNGPWYIELQRRRFYGWQQLDIQSFYNGGGSVASWNCAGSGNHLYIGRLHGPLGQISSGQVRITC